MLEKDFLPHLYSYQRWWYRGRRATRVYSRKIFRKKFCVVNYDNFQDLSSFTLSFSFFSPPAGVNDEGKDHLLSCPLHSDSKYQQGEPSDLSPSNPIFETKCKMGKKKLNPFHSSWELSKKVKRSAEIVVSMMALPLHSLARLPKLQYFYCLHLRF